VQNEPLGLVSMRFAPHEKRVEQVMKKKSRKKARDRKKFERFFQM
jgi:hypothetical protein